MAMLVDPPNGVRNHGKHYYFMWQTLFEIDTKYEPIKPIGRGAYGIVCSSINRETNEKVAIKKIHNVFDNRVDALRTLRELKLLRHLRHENVIALKDIMMPPHRRSFRDVYLVYELMDTDLHQIIKSSQALSNDHCQYFLFQLLRGLKYIHSANILHRDLKPGNLLVNANCELKICDFGLARASSGKGQYMTEYVVTRWYRAPELLLCCDYYGTSIDVWSVGCIFAELLGRKPIFPGTECLNQLKLIINVLGTMGDSDIVNVSYNSLSGEIPSGLGNLQMLETLHLNNNQLDGEVPASFSKLSSLLVCNLSYNYLFGSLPNTPVFRSMDDSNFLGNYGLCGSGTKACQPTPVPLYIAEPGWVKRTSKEKIVSISAVVVGLISLVLTIGLCWSMKYRMPVLVKLEEHKQGISDLYYLPSEGITYQEILKATDDFSESAVIGKGACGTVYKAVMLDGGIIAVKKLKSHAEGSSIDSSFRAEISTLGNVRHRNIVKLYGFCYHQDSNLILYEYMANGSLGEMLHGSGESCLLDWNTRYRIALGAAEGLRYLHYDCKPQIIHRDIKSNNILLDEAMEAHVGDFGLAKLIDISHSKTMSAVAGSYGYIAPEYAFTMKVTEKCDIYSFGVVLLELVTGQSPIQPIEQGGDLVNLVRRSIHNNTATSNVFDSRLDLTSKSTMEEMPLVLKIALFCTNDSPFDRPTMRDVIAMLMDVRGSICFSPSSPSSEAPLDQSESPRG